MDADLQILRVASFSSALMREVTVVTGEGELNVDDSDYGRFVFTVGAILGESLAFLDTLNILSGHLSDIQQLIKLSPVQKSE